MILGRTSCRLILSGMFALVLAGTTFAQSDKKNVYGILIDNTGSLRTQFDRIIQVSKGIVGQTYDKGPISLFTFQSTGDRNNPLATISSDLQWSQDPDELDQSIDELYVIGGQTTLRDAINTIGLQLNAKATDDKNVVDKILFLITDGEDRSSKIGEKELVKSLQDNGVKVYAVGLVAELDSQGGFVRKDTRGKATSFLKRITKETGGRVVFSENKGTDAKELLKELFAK